MMKNTHGKLALLLPLTLIAATALFSQSVIICPAPTKFQLRGTIEGGHLGSRVALKDFKNGHSRSVVTDDCGRYVFTDVAPSITYEISASHGSHASSKHRFFLMFSMEKDVVFDFTMPTDGWVCATGLEHCLEGKQKERNK